MISTVVSDITENVLNDNQIIKYNVVYTLIMCPLCLFLLIYGSNTTPIFLVSIKA